MPHSSFEETVSYFEYFQSGHSNPTLRRHHGFQAENDAEALHTAMAGKGCDEQTIATIICKRTNAQRQEIKQAYKAKYQSELVKDLMKELKSNMEDLVVALMTASDEFDATQIHKSVKGLGTAEIVLIEILCSRTNAEIQKMKFAYRHLFARDMDKDIAGDTSGDFKKLLQALTSANRDESIQVNPAKAQQDAEALYKAGEGKLGTDEALFTKIFATQSYAQLQAIFKEYKSQRGHDIEQAIKKEFSGDTREALFAIVKCVKNRPAFFAERLFKAMKGMGCDDSTLIRVIVSRSEYDMREIKQAYLDLYKVKLEDAIAKEAKGHYQAALLSLVTE